MDAIGRVDAPRSVGWDDCLVQNNSSASDTSSSIERTRDVTFDANDYSRFKNIGAGEDSSDEANGSKTTPAPAGSDKCRNCHKTGAKLKCSICKKAAYCARSCQASDWKFHKRTCKKPEPPKKPETAPSRPSSSASDASTNGSSGTSASTSSSGKSSSKTTSSKPSTSSSGSKLVVDEADLDSNVRGYKNGLPYFHRELSKEEQNLIGDIAPKKVESAVQGKAQHQGSAWNAAGTFEERNFTKWAEGKLKELIGDAEYTDGNVHAKLQEPEKLSGDASVCVVRGKKRYLFDFTCTVPFEVTMESGRKFKGKYHFNELSNDDCEMECKITKRPQDASENTVLSQFVGAREKGLQRELRRIIDVFDREFQSL